MKKSSNLFSLILLCGLILTACSTTSATQTQSTEPAAAASNPTEAPTQESQSTEAASTQAETGSTVQHTDIPASPPASGGEKWGDHSTVSTVSAGRALIGDDFSDGKFERPYNANTMDVYFPHLDIDK